MIRSAPIARQMSAFSSFETTQTGVAPPLSGVLRGEPAEAAARAPDQDVVALLHAGAVAADQLPVRRGVDQARRGRLLPREVAGLGHQLVGLHQRDLREAAEVGLEAPDPLLGVEHRVVVTVGSLELHAQAVRDDLVAGLPQVHAGAGAQHDARQVRADHVVRQVVPLGQRAQPAVPLEEPERRHRLEDARPDGVVVDRARHHGHQRLARPELGHRHLVDVQRLARVLVPALQPLEHVHLVLVDGHRAVGLGDGDAGELLVRGVTGQDGVADLLHAPQGSSGSRRVGRSVRSRNTGPAVELRLVMCSVASREGVSCAW